MFIVQVIITLRPSILDPQGSVIAGSLRSLGFDLSEARTGKFFEIRLAAADEASAAASVTAMCTQLLANPVIEEFRLLHIERCPAADDVSPDSAREGVHL